MSNALNNRAFLFWRELLLDVRKRYGDVQVNNSKHSVRVDRCRVLAALFFLALVPIALVVQWLMSLLGVAALPREWQVYGAYSTVGCISCRLIWLPGRFKHIWSTKFYSTLAVREKADAMPIPFAGGTPPTHPCMALDILGVETM